MPPPPKPWERYQPPQEPTQQGRPWERYQRVGPVTPTPRRDLNFFQRAGRGAVGTGETLLTTLTGAAGGILGEGSALLASIGNRIDPYEQDTVNPDQLAASVSEAMTYRPRTEAGQDYVMALGRKLRPIGETIEALSQEPGGEVAEHGIKTAFNVLPVRLGAGIRPRISPNAAVRTARELGLSTEPRQVVQGQAIGTTGQRVGAAIGGKAALPAEASLRNQPRIQALVGEDLGLPQGEWITPETVSRLRGEANTRYQAIRNLTNRNGQSFRVNLARDSQYLADIRKIAAESRDPVSGYVEPSVASFLSRYGRPQQNVTTGGVLDTLQVLRDIARREFQSDKPNDVLARATRNVALSIENALDRQIANRAPNLINGWRQSRTQLARLHAVEEAMVGSEIDARRLARLRDQGVMLTGNMAKLADVAQVMPRVMQTGDQLGTRRSPGVLDTSITAGGGAGIGAYLGGDPQSAIAGGVLGPMAWDAARRAGRRYALSPTAPIFERAVSPTAGAALATGQQAQRNESFYEYLQRQRNEQ